MLTDVFIAGGGPAGLAAAIAACRRGMQVVVADGAHPGADKACGEGLMPEGRAALARLGVTIPAEDSFPIRGIRFIDGPLTAEAAFPGLGALGVRRTVLHRLLAERALECGAALRWGTPVSAISEVRCRYLIGADGHNSALRRWAGLDRIAGERRRFGFRRHFAIEPWSDRVEVHWARGCQMYVTPVAPRRVCVALLSRDPHLRLDAALELFPALQRWLRSSEQTEAERGGVTVHRRLRSVCREDAALVGDASGSVDAITGMGICLSFLQAEALAGAMAAGDLAMYQEAHRRIRRGPVCMARLLLLMDGSDAIRRRAMTALSASPALFAGLLAAHTGGGSPGQITSTAAALGWGVLRA